MNEKIPFVNETTVQFLFPFFLTLFLLPINAPAQSNTPIHSQRNDYQNLVRDISKNVYEYQREATLYQLRYQALSQITRATKMLPDILAYQKKYRPHKLLFQGKVFLHKILGYLNISSKFMDEQMLYEKRG